MKSFKFSNFMVIAAACLLFPVYQAKAEVLYVDSYLTPTVMSSPLVTGSQYTIIVTGTYVYDSYYNTLADAEWAQNNPPIPPEPWVENRHVAGFADLQDLLIDEVPRDWWGTTDGEHFFPHTYSPSHEYRLYDFIGTGQPLAFRIEDSWGSAIQDNNGSLRVEIIPEPATLLLLGLGGLALLRKRRV